MQPRSNFVRSSPAALAIFNLFHTTLLLIYGESLIVTLEESSNLELEANNEPNRLAFALDFTIGMPVGSVGGCKNEVRLKLLS